MKISENNREVCDTFHFSPPFQIPLGTGPHWSMSCLEAAREMLTSWNKPSGGPCKCLEAGAHRPGKWGAVLFSLEERRCWVWRELTADCHYQRGIIVEVEVLDPYQGCTVIGQVAAGTGCYRSNSCQVEIKTVDSRSS